MQKLDLRKAPVFERHPMIFEAWDKVPSNSELELINDHDLKPLRYQLDSEYPDGFIWQYVSEGPDEWVIRLTKLPPVAATGKELRDKVEKALDKARPYLLADGGDIELVEIDELDMVVKVRLTGACKGCPSAGITLKANVQSAIFKAAPEITAVESVA